MKFLDEFSIPLLGLAEGSHEFEYQIDKRFFNAFENTEIKNGNFKVNVALKKSSSRIDFTFHIAGDFESTCDRCLNEIKVYLEDEYDLIGKYGEGEEEAEIFYIPDQNIPLNISKFIYEYVNYSIPLMKVCEEDENPSCYELLDNINPETEDVKNSMWDELNKINFNKIKNHGSSEE